MTTLEANIDGLVGPTHNYAGLSFGNVASEKHARSISSPRAAALQGLAKMKFMHDLGIPQLVMPPRPQPPRAMLRALGYKALAEVSEELLPQLLSASAMWAANAATVSPSADTADGKVHFTPANLVSKFHRSIEPPFTAHYLKQIFPGEHFVHHDPLPAHLMFSDEGAANHMRLCKAHGEKGLEIFVYGGASQKYPARQSRQSFEAIGRLHRLDAAQALFLEQNPQAIDAGVFHNDVIAMSNETLLIYHERAYLENPESVIASARSARGDPDKKKKDWIASPLARNDESSRFAFVKISEKELPLKEAVSTYFFNSQLVTLPGGGMAVIAPSECEENPKASSCFTRLKDEGHIKDVHYLDVRESMKNGGGPACLRLRVVLTAPERQASHKHAWLNNALYQSLCQWIETHYRDKMSPDDLRDPMLADESERALADLSQLLKISIGQ